MQQKKTAGPRMNMDWYAENHHKTAADSANDAEGGKCYIDYALSLLLLAC